MLTSGKYPQSTDKTTEIKRVAQPTRNLLEAELSLELCSLSLSRCGFLFGSLQHVADSRGKFGDGGTSFSTRFKRKRKRKTSLNHLNKTPMYSQMPMTSEHSVFFVSS